MRTAAQMLGILVMLAVWVLWIVVANAIPTQTPLGVDLVAILAGPIVGLLVYTEVMGC
jgi:hypothetical protein